MTAKRVVVLISGSGSNLQALIDKAGDNYEIVAVISNRPKVKGLERAEKAGIKAITLDHKTFESREAFDQALAELILAQAPDAVALAGFMRILTEAFVSQFEGRMLNIHPSLLPLYPGLNTHQRAIDAADAFGGCTVHFVTATLDGGPPVLQAKVAISPADTAETLARNVLQQEHIVYPMALDWLCSERLTLQGEAAVLDGKVLPASGQIL